MAKKVLSIEIGVHKTKLCVLDYKSNNPKVYHCMIMDTPYDSVDDGLIKYKVSLSNEIRKTLKSAKIKAKDIVFTVNSTKIANREVILPYVKENRIGEVVKANASEYFPMDISDYHISYMVLEKNNGKEEKNYRVLVLAAQNSLIISYYELAKELGMNVESIDYIGNSVFQISQKQKIDRNSMLINIGDKSTIVNVFSNKVQRLQRIIPYGADAVLDAICENEYYGKISESDAVKKLVHGKLINPYFNMSYDELTATLNMSTQTDGNEKVELQEMIAKVQITSSLQYLIQNINRAIDYYDSKHSDSKITSIYLTGMGASFSGIDQLVNNELTLDTKVLTKLEGVTFTKSCKVNDIFVGEMLSTIGAAINPIGLVPIELVEKQKTKQNVQSVVVFGGLSIVASAALIYFSTVNLNDAIHRKEVLTRQVEELSTIESIYTEHSQVLDTLNKLKEMEASAYNGNEELVTLIEDLEANLPRNVVVNSFRATTDGIMMDMTTTSKENAAYTLMKLKEIPLLTEVTTYSISEELDELSQVKVKFAVTAKYKITSSLEVTQDE